MFTTICRYAQASSQPRRLFLAGATLGSHTLTTMVKGNDCSFSLLLLKNTDRSTVYAQAQLKLPALRYSTFTPILYFVVAKGQPDVTSRSLKIMTFLSRFYGTVYLPTPCVVHVVLSVLALAASVGHKYDVHKPLSMHVCSQLDCSFIK